MDYDKIIFEKRCFEVLSFLKTFHLQGKKLSIKKQK